MSCITVRTQSELDTALRGATNETCIHIESGAGVWLRLSASGSATVRAYGSATVEAYGSATVEASDSATVRAYGSATVAASAHVAVHLHSAKATVTGGILIDLTQLDLTDAAAWCAHHGVDVIDGRATLYKCTDAALTAGHEYRTTTYSIGAEVTAEDWRDDHMCGGGLHLSPRPWQATAYTGGKGHRRWLRCTADLTDLRPIEDDKCKVRSCRVEAEIDEYARELTTSGGVQ